MKWLDRALDGLSSRTWTLTNPAERWLQRTYAGKTVTVSSALGLAPFYRGVQLLSGSVGMMPCKVYRDVTAEQSSMSTRKFNVWLSVQRETGRLAGHASPADLQRGRVEAGRRSRAWQLLHDRPNPTMAADEFWALLESHIDTWGNAYALKDWGPNTTDGIDALWPIDPCRVQVGRLDDGSGKRFYVLDGDMANPATDNDILHIRGLSSDGLVGYSPVALHRQSLGGAMARDEFTGRFWDNDSTPGITLMHPGKLSPEAIDRVKAKWEHHHKGPRNARKVAVLAENMSIQQMTMPLRDAQYIEGQQMDATTQALILGIPPYMVGGLMSGSLTYSTTEAQSLDLLKWSLSPRLVRLQNAVTWDPDLMPRSWFAEFETGAIMRATTKERYEAWSIAPHLTVNEMREMDNLPPIDGGDELSKSMPAAPADPAVMVGDKPSGGNSNDKP
ncbi:MAG: phage portal protein [Panacagrimonas sp.]